MESPSQQLADKIITRLINENILTSERGRRMQVGLAEGRLKSDDWKLEIELSKATTEDSLETKEVAND